MTRILIADDHPMISTGIELLLRGSPYRLVGRARSGAEAVDQVAQLDPDLLLLDVHMPDGTGIDVLRALRTVGSGPQIVLLTAGLDDQMLLEADDLAPDGSMLKTADPALLFDCLDRVRLGERWLDPDIAARLKILRAKAADAPALAPRERQMIGLIRRGLKNRDNERNEQVQERTRTTTTSTQGVVNTVVRDNKLKQVTGFNLTGYNGSVTTTTEDDGPKLNSCPNANSSFVLGSTVETVVSEGDSVLEVTNNGATWTPLITPSI